MSSQASAAGTYTFFGTDRTVNRMGYGAMQLAGPGVWGPPRDEKAAVSVLREAVELGIDHIDTSDFYGPYVTNQLIKRALYPYPKGTTIVTKIGFKRGADKSWKPARSKIELTEAVHSNLKNLGLEALDVVNLRFDDSGSAPVAEALSTLVELKEKGFIRAIGLSNVTEKQFDEARAITPIACVQNHYNLAHRKDDAFIDKLAALQIPYVPYFPLGGFKPLQSMRLSEVSTELKATPMQVALAWLLHRSPNMLLIPGTSSLTHLRENIKAAEFKLPAAALEALNEF